MKVTGKVWVSTESILECVDPAEYAALVDAAKDGFRIIISSGQINMGVGSINRARLLQIFPSGITHNAITSRWEI